MTPQEQTELVASLESQGWTIDAECEERQAALLCGPVPPTGLPVFMKSPDGLIRAVGGTPPEA